MQDPSTLNTIRVHDRAFSLSIPRDELEAAITTVATRINHDLQGTNPIFLVILNGAFMFAADLFKKLEMECEISFVKLTSYAGTKSSGIVRELVGLTEDLNERTVVVVEDIIDTGITMDHLITRIMGLGAKEVRIATMLFKPEAFQKDFHIDYIGMEIPNEFIVGYGLDYDGHGRNLPDIYKVV